MFVYFVIFSWIGLQSLLGGRCWSRLTAFGIWATFTVLIGLRVEVGPDWYAYILQLQQQIGEPLGYPLSLREPGYALANWISAYLSLDIYGTNLLCGGLFSAGLVRYCRNQPFPWLALTLAFPYLVVVVAMGYARQGVAVGLELLALQALERDRLLQYLVWLGLASTFHASALTMLVLPLVTIRRDLGRLTDLLRLILLAGVAFVVYNAILSALITTYREIYLEAEYQSQGALIRIALCLLPALIFLWNLRKFPIPPQQRSIYMLMSWLAVALAIVLVVSPSSTAVDRVALYLIPLQIFVGSYLPLIRLQGFSVAFWIQLMVLFSLAVLSVWLFYSAFASAWIPYRNLLFEF